MKTLIFLITYMRNEIYRLFFLKLVLSIDNNSRLYHMYTNNTLKKITLVNKANSSSQHKTVFITFFCIYKEICKRLLKSKPRKSQFEGSIASCYNFLVEMGTGQGKTLSMLGTTLWKLYSTKNIIHFISSNTYLVKRDFEYSVKIMQFFNFKSSNKLSSNIELIHLSRVVYSDIQSLGFSFLKNLSHPTSKYKSIFDVIIFDEIDSFLYEVIQVPLTISNPSKDNLDKYLSLSKVKSLVFSSKDKISSNQYYESYSNKSFSSNKTSLFNPSSNAFYWKYMLRLIESSFLDFRKNIHYIVKNNKLVLLDKATGRPMAQHKLSKGFHEAIETKEGISTFKSNNNNNNTLNLIDFISLYKKVIGFSATLGSELYLSFLGIHFLVYRIQSPSKRIDYKPLNLGKIFLRSYLKDWVFYKQSKRQPLIFYIENIQKTHHFKEAFFKSNKKRNLILNAKNIKNEVNALNKAGAYNQILTSTNVISRGSNISISKQSRYKVEPSIIQMLGGIYLSYFEVDINPRFLEQLKGRVGRQNIPGESRSLFTYLTFTSNKQLDHKSSAYKKLYLDYVNYLYPDNKNNGFLKAFIIKQESLLSNNIKYLSSLKSNLPSTFFTYMYLENFFSKTNKIKYNYYTYIEQSIIFNMVSRNIFLNYESIHDISYILAIHIEKRLSKKLILIQKEVATNINSLVYMYIFIQTYKKLLLWKISGLTKNIPYFYNQMESIFVKAFLDKIEEYKKLLDRVYKYKSIPLISLNRDNITQDYISILYMNQALELFYQNFFIQFSIQSNRINVFSKKAKNGI